MKQHPRESNPKKVSKRRKVNLALMTQDLMTPDLDVSITKGDARKNVMNVKNSLLVESVMMK